MFAKIGRAAEQMASSVRWSRRGFLSRFAAVAGGAALGVSAFWTPAANAAPHPCSGACGLGNDALILCYCKRRGTCCVCCQGNPDLILCQENCCAQCGR
jgi:hypothetical protein